NKLIAQNNVTGCTMMVNKPLLDMIKSPPKNDIMHDWWLALIASCFGKIGFIDKPLMLYRQHFNHSVGAKNTKSLLYNLKRAFNKSGSEKVLNDTFLQAEEFLNTYEKLLNENDKTLIENYVKIPHMNKFMKIITLFKYDFLKHSLKRKLGQILYI
ncbi:MAG: glycosyltransferase family 2 protein, partial [Clostridia bacterium]|nr:glycosyltransferase family 2 protein [Clostridia bacterium]